MYEYLALKFALIDFSALVNTDFYAQIFQLTSGIMFVKLLFQVNFIEDFLRAYDNRVFTLPKMFLFELYSLL